MMTMMMGDDDDDDDGGWNRLKQIAGLLYVFTERSPTWTNAFWSRFRVYRGFFCIHLLLKSTLDERTSSNGSRSSRSPPDQPWQAEEAEVRFWGEHFFSLTDARFQTTEVVTGVECKTKVRAMSRERKRDVERTREGSTSGYANLLSSSQTNNWNN